jgi:hypothetical protein
MECGCGPRVLISPHTSVDSTQWVPYWIRSQLLKIIKSLPRVPSRAFAVIQFVIRLSAKERQSTAIFIEAVSISKSSLHRQSFCSDLPNVPVSWSNPRSSPSLTVDTVPHPSSTRKGSKRSFSSYKQPCGTLGLIVEEEFKCYFHSTITTPRTGNGDQLFIKILYFACRNFSC